MSGWSNLSLNETYPILFNEFNAMSIVVKIVGVILYIIICIGNMSIIGISHYEKYGQDPRKRSFPDQIFGFGFFVFAFVNFTSATMILIRSFFGPIGNILAIFHYALYSILLGIPMSWAESIIFKCLLIFFWKRFAALDDDFFAVFFNIFNFLIVGLGITIVRLMTGEFQHRIEFDYWSGIEIVDDNKYST